MSSGPPPWQHRARRIIIGGEWVAIAIGIIASIVDSEVGVEAYIASGLGAIWVLASTSVPFTALQRPLVLDAFTLGGVVLTMTAVAVTGAAGSPFFLLSLTPSMLAALLGGFRQGIAASVLSTALAVAMTLAREDSLGFALGLAMLYPIIALTVAQVRRILLDLEQRAAEAEEGQESRSLRLEQLESANALLANLAEITGGNDINPITIGRAGLEAIAARYPDAAAAALLNGENGPILVARHGAPIAGGHEHVIPLVAGETTVGSVRLTTGVALDAGEVDSLRDTLRPLALAFANALLLQDIARSAVREERTRLARELHDEIGPSLASLGLALDVALINAVDQREVGDHLEQLRDRVGGLVEEVRATVSDLRSPTAPTMTSLVAALEPELPPNVQMLNDVDERRPARPSIAQDVRRILTEAMRNAFRHSGASTIRIRGWVDFDRGRLVVEDNGNGFDLASVPRGHFGIVGMKERAEAAGLRLTIGSSGKGTRVELEWGQP